ncbi:MAG: ABC transporter ATP-binding protein [Clostridium sp.]
MIKLINITKKYGEVYAVKNMNLHIQSGKILGLIGPNGAGKSTTIGMIIGTVDQTEGDILVRGTSIRDNIRAAKGQIGYVSDDENQTLSLKAIEYLNFVGDMYRVSQEDRKERILELSETFKIRDRLGERLDSFSKGMKQKIMIIASLIHNPPIWILDEPFNGLDPEIAYTLKTFMREYANRGNTILLSSHILEILEGICDEVLLIKKGETIFSGSLDNLREKFSSRYTLEDIYIEIFKNNNTTKLEY